MTGLILCGGRSSRMGSDKGLLHTSGITWAETACSKLATVVSSVAISVNSEQLPSYSRHFTEKQLIVDNDHLKIGGPLCGLLSAHIQMPEEDIFLFACDLLFMQTIVFEKLQELQKQSPGHEAFVFTQGQETEPLCGIYTAGALRRILAAYQDGSLGKQSMKHALESVNTLRTELPGDWQHYFKNINTRHDLNS